MRDLRAQRLLEVGNGHLNRRALALVELRQVERAWPLGKRGAPLSPAGTDFQKRVWQALLRIPWGKTTTYGALAARLGSSPRAVGSAVGRNPISVIIPCHRVIAADGGLAGYAGGLENKEKLLRLEGVLK